MKVLFCVSTVSLVTMTTILGMSSQAQAGVFTTNASSFGNYSSTGVRSTTTYLTGKNSTTGTTETNRSFFVFDLPVDMAAAYRTIISSQVSITNPTNGFIAPGNPAPRTFNVTQVLTPNLSTAGNSTAIFNDLGATGTGNLVYGSTVVTLAINSQPTLVTVDLGSTANTDILASAGSSFAVGGSLTLGGSTARQVLFNGSNGSGTEQLQITFADAQAATNGNQNFGNVLVGQSANANVTVTNSGEAGSSLSGSIGASSNSSITPTAGSTSFSNLGSGQSATRTFTFAAGQRGVQQTTIGITSNTEFAISDPILTGVGVAAQNAITSVNNNAGFVRIGTQATVGFNVENQGDGNLSGLGAISNLNGTVSQTGSNFSLTSGSVGALSLGDGAVETYSYTYAPTTRGAVSDTVNLDFSNGSDDGTNQAQQQTVTLSATGVGPEFASSVLPGSTINFGSVPVGQTGLFSLVITNNTTDPTNGANPELSQLTLLDSLFEGAGAGAFSLLNFTPGTVLQAGESLTLQLQFTPLTANDFQQAVLRIITDQGVALGNEGEEFSFNLEGTGFTPNVTVPEPSSAFGLMALFGAGILFPRKKAANKNSLESQI